MGIITLEDVLEGTYRERARIAHCSLTFVAELIGEEIYDEFDAEGQSHVKAYSSLPTKSFKARGRQRDRLAVNAPSSDTTAVEGHSAPATSTATPQLLTVPVPVRFGEAPISIANSIL